MEAVYKIKYILSPNEEKKEDSDEEFLKQLQIQNENLKKSFEKIKCSPENLKDTLRQNFASDGVLVLWQKQSISFGKWDGNDYLFFEENSKIDPFDVLELRLFNEDKELYLLKKGQIFEGRLAKDDGEGFRLAADTLSRFWGENMGEENGFIILRDEGRKLEMKIPFADASSRYYGLKTRNYIGEIGDAGQLSYLDYRFLAIEPMD